MGKTQLSKNEAAAIFEVSARAIEVFDFKISHKNNKAKVEKFKKSFNSGMEKIALIMSRTRVTK